MKNQKNKTKEECKKGIISGGVLVAMMAYFVSYIVENREIPFLDTFVRREALPGCILVGAIFMVIGFAVLISSKKQLNELEKLEKTGKSFHTEEKKQYAYYYCEHCRKKLRINGGKGRVQITCPVCGHQFIVNR